MSEWVGGEGGKREGRTFLTKSRTTSRRRTSSASCHSPRTSYVRRHSVTSAIHLPLSSSAVLPSLSRLLDVIDVSVLAKRWSRSEDSVDLMRSMRYPEFSE